MAESNPLEKPNNQTESSESGKISLRELLTYENPRLAEYQELIKQEHGGNRTYPGQEFSGWWIDIVKDYKKFAPYIADKLQGSILVDLGGGYSLSIEELARKFGVKTYINVEFTFGGDEISPDIYVGHKRNTNPASLFRLKMTNEEKNQPIETLDVKADILDFVSRLPTGSVNFTANGIDTNMVRKSEYRKALMEEMVRATKVGGVMFGICSDVWKKNDPRLRSIGEDIGVDKSDTVLSKKIFERVA